MPGVSLASPYNKRGRLLKLFTSRSLQTMSDYKNRTMLEPQNTKILLGRDSRPPKVEESLRSFLPALSLFMRPRTCCRQVGFKSH